jgi:hypothetical protein
VKILDYVETSHLGNWTPLVNYEQDPNPCLQHIRGISVIIVLRNIVDGRLEGFAGTRNGSPNPQELKQVMQRSLAIQGVHSEAR